MVETYLQLSKILPVIDFSGIKLHFMFYSDIVLKAKEYVTGLLKDLESKGYTFHNLDHTLRVFERAGYLAEKEGLNEELQEIIQLSALFHDTGFIKQYDKNEPIGAQIAEEWLRKQGYPEDKIDLVKQTILATELGSPVNTVLGKIIKDADMDNLGRNDFFELEKALRKELNNIKNIEFTDEERYRRINSYIQPFQFFTQTQQKERGEMFEENKRKLREMIKDDDNG